MKRVTYVRFTLQFATVREVGKAKARLRPVLEVQGVDWAGSWEWSAWCTGTLDGLVRAYLRSECPAGVLMDRLEECPEEAGGPHSVLPLVVEYLRRTLPIESLYEDPATTAH